MDIRVIISQMAVLFILIAIGYIVGRIKMLTPDGTKALSRVVLNIGTPGMILHSVMSDTGSITGSNTAFFMFMILLAYLLYFIVGIPMGRALGSSEAHNQGSGTRGQEMRVTGQGSGDENSGADGGTAGRSNSGLYGAMIVFGNVGFMGFPVAYAIFGAESMFYVALFNVAFNILTYSVGILMISGQGGKINLKLLINATFASALISFVLVFTDFEMPSVITEVVRLAGGINTPCAMFVIGATLAQISFKDVFSKWQLYPTTLIKMIVMPIVAWLLFKQFVADELMLGLLVVMSGMPIAAAVAMIPNEYGGDTRLASSGVFLTTLLSGVTIPLIAHLILS